MNGQNTMQPLGETKSLQNIVIDEVCQKISDAVIDAEATSEEKYITKQKLIVSADEHPRTARCYGQKLRPQKSGALAKRTLFCRSIL